MMGQTGAVDFLFLVAGHPGHGHGPATDTATGHRPRPRPGCHGHGQWPGHRPPATGHRPLPRPRPGHPAKPPTTGHGHGHRPPATDHRPVFLATHAGKMMFFFSKFPIPPLAARAFNDYYIPFIAISTPLPGSPCFQ